MVPRIEFALKIHDIELRKEGQMQPEFATEFLLGIQRQQFMHDENFHREIARLSVANRLKHMALHISKYFSRIVLAGDDTEKSGQPWLDTFIISTSIANILNVRLSDIWKVESELRTSHLRRWIAEKCESNERLIDRLAFANDRLSSACEKIDHLESHDYRAEITAVAGTLSLLAANEIFSRHGDFSSPVAERLKQVKRKSIFFEG